MEEEYEKGYEELNAKDFAKFKIAEILQICSDLHYIENKELRIKGIMQIEKLANGIEEHLEHLEIKELKIDE